MTESIDARIEGLVQETEERARERGLGARDLLAVAAELQRRGVERLVEEVEETLAEERRRAGGPGGSGDGGSSSP